MFGPFNFFISRSLGFFKNNVPRKCYGYLHLKKWTTAFSILETKCDCIIWCKFPPSRKLIKL